MSEIEKTKTGKRLGNHEVGYGHPPKNSQFKKGHSGNPKGRARKHERCVEDMVRDLIRREIPIREGGETRSVSFLEAFFMDWSMKALGGTAKEKSDYYKALRENFAGALEPTEPEPVKVDTQVKPLRLIYPEEPERSQEPSGTPSASSTDSSHGDRS